MLSRSEIDRLEAMLFNATLQDVPRIFGKVLPLIFAELRVMQLALDKQAEEFLFHDRASEEKQSRPESGVVPERGGVEEGRGGSPEPMGAGNLEPPMGGELRKRKRGRPPKSSKPVDAVLTDSPLEIQPSPRLMEDK